LSRNRRRAIDAIGAVVVPALHAADPH